MLAEIDLLDPRISVPEARALQLMLEKREKYVDQGRKREAHGLGTGTWILWRTLIQEPAGSSGYGEL
jgi:hypothetical protein